MSSRSQDEDVRWKQRFQNYSRAFALLREAFEPGRELSQLDKEGVIQRFAFRFELAWKLLKDRMEGEGLLLDWISPKSVIRLAHENKFLKEPEIWLRMVGDRNLMSHTYDVSKFEAIIETIRESYLSCFEALYLDFLEDV